MAMTTMPAISVDPSRLFSFTLTISMVLAPCIFLAALIGLAAMWLGARKRPSAISCTWDCGYSAPDPSMQYTASSFAAPLLGYFKRPLALHKKIEKSQDLFPSQNWKFNSGVDDWILSKIFLPAFKSCDTVFSSLRWFQNGKSGQYVLYIAVTIVCLVIWKFFL
jgi:hypothetical protein